VFVIFAKKIYCSNWGGWILWYYGKSGFEFAIRAMYSLTQNMNDEEISSLILYTREIGVYHMWRSLAYR